MKQLSLIALESFPEVRAGDDLAQLIIEACVENKIVLQEGDVLVIAQKIISKAEDRYVNLTTVNPSEEALFLASLSAKDPRLIELILRESDKVLRVRDGLIIVEHKLGFVHANAGIDSSNLSLEHQTDWVLLLPQQPNQSAERISKTISNKVLAPTQSLAVIVNDSMGRAWRNGTIGTTIGCYGIAPVFDFNGCIDRGQRELQATQVAIADEISAAASLLMGQCDESRPVVILRGWNHRNTGHGSPDQPALPTLLRAPEQDLFR